MADPPLDNLDPETVASFGEEWTRFDQAGLSAGELAELFDQYFAVFPWDALPAGAEGFDAGCGSGRWARLVAPRVGRLHCVDASGAALEVARRNLADLDNVAFHEASVAALPLGDGTQDFGYSLGVLHHVPDTAAGLAACARKLKPGAPLLVYLYYAFDNRPWWYAALHRASEAVRAVVSRLPGPGKRAVAGLIALGVYLPLARLALLAERARLPGAGNLPLAYYRQRSLYVMRNDALDRFGTPLEQRFTRAQIEAMMRAAGLERIAFSPDPPYWCAVGHRVSPA